MEYQNEGQLKSLKHYIQQQKKEHKTREFHMSYFKLSNSHFPYI